MKWPLRCRRQVKKTGEEDLHADDPPPEPPESSESPSSSDSETDSEETVPRNTTHRYFNPLFEEAEQEDALHQAYRALGDTVRLQELSDEDAEVDTFEL